MRDNQSISEVNEIDKNKNNFIHKINLAFLYFILLILILGIIYFYSVYRNEYLSILIPFTKIWPVTMILIGISIFRINNTSSLAIGLLLVSSLVAITISAIFVQTALIKDVFSTKSVSVVGVSKIATDINLTLAQASMNASNTKFFKGESSSNYDDLDMSNYKDDSGVENITVNNSRLPNGVGSYSKNTKIVFPNSIPAIFDIKSKFSNLDSNLKTLKVSSGTFDLIGSNADIIVSDVEQSASLSIKSILSQVNLVVDDNINVTFSSSSSLTQQELIGLSPSVIDKRIYKSNNKEILDPDKEDKRQELVIILNATLSKIKIIQQDI